MKNLFFITLLSTLLILGTVSNSFAVWYTCKVAGITPSPNGQVNVNLLPGTGETRFTEKSRVRLNSSAGANNILATILTAISLNMEIKFNLDYIPSLDNQDILGINLVIE